jgi:hypothetical protein
MTLLLLVYKYHVLSKEMKVVTVIFIGWCQLLCSYE